MISFRAIARLTAILLFATALGIALGCGGTNTSTPTTSNPVARFTPDTAVPAAGTIALLSGSSSGASVNVRVTVTGVSGFFGATFRVKYDPAALLYNGMTSTDSFLSSGGVASGNLLFLEDHASVPGEISITATRIDPTVAPPVDVTTTADLVVLNFTARLAIVAATAEGRLDFDDPKQVCNGTVVPPGCGTIAVTWTGGGVSAQ
jgi:hypothetical protein